MNLIAFLEFLIETQRALRESVKTLTSTTTARTRFAELKRLQDELHEEISPLKDKIKAELQPAAGGRCECAPQGSRRSSRKGLQLLQGWADTAGEKMTSAAQEALEPASRAGGP